LLDLDIKFFDLASQLPNIFKHALNGVYQANGQFTAFHQARDPIKGGVSGGKDDPEFQEKSMHLIDDGGASIYQGLAQSVLSA